MSHPILVARRAQQARLLAQARRWARRLPASMEVSWVAVVGSVARGDFNKWSDLDVLVVAANLPVGARARLATLQRGAPPGLQAVGWTPEEFARRLAQRDPMAREAAGAGIIVRGAGPGPG